MRGDAPRAVSPAPAPPAAGGGGGVPVRGGDVEREAAFEALHRATHEALWRFAYAQVRCPAVAEELVQEAFLALWRRPDRWHGGDPGAARAWLFTAVRHHALNHRRHERVVRRLDAALVPGGGGAAANATGGVAPAGREVASGATAGVDARARTVTEPTGCPALGAPPADVVAAIEGEELERAVDGALARLPERRRLAMLLRWRHELTPAEIARVLQTTPESVRVLLSRARHDLARLLGLGNER